MQPDELSGWDEIRHLAGTGNPASGPRVQVAIANKMTLAMVNLGQALLSHQKVTGTRLEHLTKSIDRFNEQSGKLAKSANWLAPGLLAFTGVQVILAIIRH